MIRRFALACAALAIVAGCSHTRTLALNYTKAGADDVTAAKDRKAFEGVSGVTSVVAEPGADGTVRMQVWVEDGKELNVYGKADELGYTRLK